VTSYEGFQIIIQLKELGIRIRIGFDDNPLESGKSISIVPTSEDEVEITMRGYQQSLGEGTNRPMKFARFDDRQYYIQIRTWAVPGSTPTIIYTIYRDSEYLGNKP